MAVCLCVCVCVRSMPALLGPQGMALATSSPPPMYTMAPIVKYESSKFKIEVCMTQDEMPWLQPTQQGDPIVWQALQPDQLSFFSYSKVRSGQLWLLAQDTYPWIPAALMHVVMKVPGRMQCCVLLNVLVVNAT